MKMVREETRWNLTNFRRVTWRREGGREGGREGRVG